MTYGCGLFVGNQLFPVVAAYLTRDAAEGAPFPWPSFWSFFAYFATAVAILFLLAFHDKTKLGDRKASAAGGTP